MRPVARIWVQKVRINMTKLLKSVCLHNPSIRMKDWVVFSEEKPEKNNLAFQDLNSIGIVGILEPRRSQSG